MIIVIDTEAPELLSEVEVLLRKPGTSGNKKYVRELDRMLAARRNKTAILKLLNPRKIPGFGDKAVLLSSGATTRETRRI